MFALRVGTRVPSLIWPGGYVVESIFNIHNEKADRFSTVLRKPLCHADSIEKPGQDRALGLAHSVVNFRSPEIPNDAPLPRAIGTLLANKSQN